MLEIMQKLRTPLLPGVVALALATAYLIALLAAEKQPLIIGLLAFAVVAVLAAHYLGWLNLVSRSFADREDALGVYAILAACVVAAFFHDNHFVLLLFVTVLLYTVATLGLNIQFGYAGVLNFAGASFFGIGAYTSAVLSAYTAVPHLLVLLIGGMLAALIGSLLLLPVLRTRGHYAALVTIAFALLLKTFLEVNDVLGGPQGMQVKGMSILGWSFNGNFEIGKIEMSFYLNYFVVSMLLLTGTFADSLIMVSILLLGGIGNPWGLVVATFIVVVVPEKLQTIQEYRILLFALIVIMMLLFRPEGLLPRPVRRYFPGWRA